MRTVGSCFVVLLAVAPAWPAAAVEIRHQPVECVPPDRYARIEAEAVPPEGAARAELQFRSAAGGPWYGAGMEKAGAAWVGFLPRPVRPLARFDYRVVATRPDLTTAETESFPVRVGSDAEPCAAGPASSAALGSPIVVRVPAGAPLVPPVPAGFSPAGVVAAEGPRPPDRWKAVKWIAGAAAAGGLAAAASGVGSGPPPPPDAPDFAFSGTTPSPGGEFSLHGGRLSVFVTVSGEPREPLAFTWVFQLHTAGFREACVTITGVANVGAERPVTLELTAPIHESFCGSRYDVERTQLTILVDGQIVYDATEPLVYHVVP